MFDKLYKEANDEIRVNTQLLEELKSEASKGKKQKTYSFMYKYGFAAAAILIMVVSLNVMPDMKKSQESEKRYPGSQEQIVKTEKNASHNEASESLTKEENKNSEEITKDDFTSEKTGVNDIKITTPPKKVQTEKKNDLNFSTNASDDIVQTEDEEKTTEETTNSSDNTITTQNTVETSDTDNTETESFSAIPEDYENIPLSRSIDGSRSISTPSTSVNISLEEYCSTFGFNPDNWAIPSGMIKTDGEEVYIDQSSTTGEYLKTNHTVIYSRNGKSIYITLLPDSDDVLSLINSGNGEMYNGNLILNNTDLSYTSYVVKNGNGYIVETNNIEKENVYSLIDSIG